MDQDELTLPGCIRASIVAGTAVYDPEGNHLGHVDDVVISKIEGRAVYAIMSFGGFLGIGERYHPLPWASLTYDPNRGGYVVSVSRDQLDTAPTFARGLEPDWDDRALSARLTDHYSPPPAAPLGAAVP